MKRLWCLLLTVLVCFCFPAAAGAAQSSLYHTGEISEAGITLNFPSEVMLITRSGLKDESMQRYLWDNGLSPFFFEQDMEESDYYIYAYSQESNFSLTVSMQTNEFSKQVGNLSQLPDRVKQGLLKMIEDDIETAETDQTDLYTSWREECPQALFLETGNNGDPYARVYQTVFNGKMVVLSFMLSFGDTKPDGELWDSIFRSLRFDEEPVIPQPTQLFPWEYTEPVTGAKFTVPAGWTTADAPAGMELPHFISEDRQKNKIDLNVQDIQTELDDSNASRRHMNTEEISPITLAKIAGLPLRDMELVDCAGLPCYHTVQQEEATIYDISYIERRHIYLHVQDGYLYTFSVNFEADDPAFASFTDFISSIHYPKVQTSLVQRMGDFISHPLSVLRSEKAVTVIPYAFLAVSLLGLLVLPLILLTMRKGSRKHGQAALSPSSSEDSPKP